MTRSNSVLFLAATIAAAQQTPPAPTFRVGTKLVEVDVVARDKKGPAAGLTKEDFKLFDNGKPQEIATFSVTSLQTAGPVRAPLPPGAISNRLDRDGEAPATATVILLDRINTLPANQIYANQRIVKSLETRRSQDRLGIYTLGNSVQVIQDLTNDRDLLSRAANSLKTQKNVPRRDSDTTGMSEHAASEYSLLELTDRAMDFKHALEAIARHLASVPGRKSLVWVTGSFLLASPPPRQDFNFIGDMEEAARALNEANVALYAVDARGLAGALSGGTGLANAESGMQTPSPIIQMRSKQMAGPTGLDTMNTLAGLTGGLVFSDTNGLEDSIQAAARDAQVTYSLGFYPLPEVQDGLWHKLKVRVARRGVSVRYRENYFASKTQSETSERPTLDQLLKDSLDATQVELIAAATPDPDHGGSYQVRVSVDLHGVQLDHQNALWVGALGISFLVEGSKTAQTITKKIEIPEDQLSADLEKGIEVNTSIASAGQNGVLRIVAQDQATGAAGSVRVPLGRR